MKKVIIILCLICALSLSSIPVGATTNLPYGDVDDSGKIDTKDVRVYLKSLVFSETAVNISDVNGDAVVDTSDVRQLLKEIVTSEAAKAELLAFKTPVNSSLSITQEEIEAHRAAQVINTYGEFEEVCAKIQPYFYTPYEDENGSFESWAETVTPEYFETKSLFMITHGTAAKNFKLNYAVSEDTVDIVIEQTGVNACCLVECWQLIVELDKEDLIGRQLNISFDYSLE